MTHLAKSFIVVMILLIVTTIVLLHLVNFPQRLMHILQLIQVEHDVLLARTRIFNKVFNRRGQHFVHLDKLLGSIRLGQLDHVLDVLLGRAI